MDIKKIGTLAAGTLMLGAALAGPVSAAMDSTGLTKGFFYDANMNPLTQIVVGENPKASPLDAVAAGNIAATIGNLAYMTKEKTVGGEGGAEGEVVISTESTESVGDYIQDDNVDTGLTCTGGTENIPHFWEDGDKLWFDDDETYEPGDFTIYNVACGRQTEREANILKEGEYKNTYCLFCETLCKEGLEFDIAHEMEESISVDSSLISYYQDGVGNYDSESLKMEIEKDAITYSVDTGYIPLESITDANLDEVDFEYRGKLLLFGEEYYVTDVKSPASATNTEIYLAKGEVLDDISNEGYTAEYNGYKFKIDHLIYSAEYVVAGILLDVQKPDGTTLQVQVSKMANGEVDDLEIAGITAEESAAVATGSILVYDKTTEVVLEDNEDLVLNGEEKDYWEVEFVKDECNGAALTGNCPGDISEYDNTDGVVLESIDITYGHDLDGAEALEVDESLEFPNNFKLMFKGFLDNHYEESPASGEGEGKLVVERGSEDYQLVMSFTGEDNNRYDDVRLDEGPFGVDDYFMLNGEVYQFTEVEEEDDTTYEITLDPVISGTREKITVNSIEDEYNITTDLTVRSLSLVDALDDDDPTELYKDEEEEFAYEDLYAGEATSVPGGDAWIVYDDSTSSVMLLDADDTNLATGTYDQNVEVNPDVAMSGETGTFDRFQVDDNTLDVGLIKEDGTDGSLTYTDDADATGLANDMNSDGEDEDTFVKFTNDDGEVFYLDFTDRNYDETLNGYYYDNNVWYDCDNSGAFDNDDVKIDKDEDSLLILPKGGDELEIDWGVDYLIESVELSHPQSKVDSTYFIGREETTSTLNESITKASEGTDVSAGCCTFHVAKFGVAGTGDGATVTTDEVNVLSPSDLGKFVVGESAADTTKNLVLVGGPAVNSMTGEVIDKEDISAEPDKYLVKKVGSKVVVAGWNKGDTVTAGNKLIGWLQENVH